MYCTQATIHELNDAQFNFGHYKMLFLKCVTKKLFFSQGSELEYHTAFPYSENG